MTWFEAIVLGVIQGITEFLPISSDGHLAVAEQGFASVRGSEVSGPESLFFNVMLHLGTLAAIVWHYRAVVRAGAKGLLGAPDMPPPYRRAALIRTGSLAVSATLPAVVVGLLFKKDIERATASPLMAGLGFLVTATALAVTPRLGRGGKSAATTSWLDALLIGSAQAIAILPGVSRSGMTIVTALALGLSRPWAVGFSLFMAVPAILGAVVLEIKEVDPAILTPERVAQTVVATIVAGLVGYLAILWLIRIVRSNRLWYFSVYLVLIALVALAGSSAGGGRDHAGRSGAVDRAVRGGPPAARVAARPGRSIGPLDRTHAPGS
jgi:undecaprenyl-diphosphatase